MTFKLNEKKNKKKTEENNGKYKEHLWFSIGIIVLSVAN